MTINLTELNYQDKPEDAQNGPGGNWSYSTIYVKRMIGIVHDLPIIHQTDGDGFCKCHVGKAQMVQVHIEQREKVKPYEWL